MSADRSSSIKKSNIQLKVTATKASMARANLNKTKTAPGSIVKKIITKNPLKTIPAKAALANKKSVSTQPTKSPQVNVRKRKAAEALETPPPTYDEVAVSLKNRAAWDLRGRLSDLKTMIQLNTKRLNAALESKTAVEDMKRQQETQITESAEKAENLRLLIKEIEEKHAAEIQEMRDKQEVKHRKLNNDYLSYANEVSEMKLKVAAAKEKSKSEKSKLTDMQLKNKIIRSSIESITAKLTGVRAKINETDEDIKVLKASIATTNAEIEKDQEQSLQMDTKIEELQQQLNTANAEKLKILQKIKDLEEKKRYKSLEKKNLL